MTKTTDVELLKAHTHAGEPRAPGDQITLDEDSAAWLIQLGVARRATKPRATTKDSTNEEGV